MNKASFTGSQSNRRIAFISAQWHKEIAHQARDAFIKEMSAQRVDAEAIHLDGVPDTFEITEVPIFSVVLTPHNYHEHEVHNTYFARHFAVKGREATHACLATLKSLEKLKI